MLRSKMFKLTLPSFMLLLVSTPAMANVGSVDAPNKKHCVQLYEHSYERSYDALDMIDSLGKTELCYADVNDDAVTSVDEAVHVDAFRERFGALCSMLADAAHANNNSLIAIYNLQCRVEAERGLTTLIDAYLLNQRSSKRTIAVWDEDLRLTSTEPLSKLKANMREASIVVVDHFIASIRESFPERNADEVKIQVVSTLAGIQNADAICEDLNAAAPAGTVCAADVAALTSGLIYRYTDLN